jgi:AbrB family looped-hinge helix DNA binding protein
MNTRLTIDKAGRVVIPKPLREELDFGPGDALEIERAGEEITLRPVRETGQRRIREERDLSNLGKSE